MENRRVIWIVLDSVGMGEAPDAAAFGDEGSNTLGNISKAVGGLSLPNMERLGLGCIEGMTEIHPVDDPIGCYARLHEASAGKDTTVGHWEMAGVITKSAFPTYPEGFPDDVIEEFVRKTGVPGVLGNCVASGTEIIQRLGDEHVKTGKPIVYTSADSVFQIAMHEDVFPVEKQYEICRIARGILKGEHGVSRVIARPFVNADGGGYVRTANRRDFSLKPEAGTVLSCCKDAGLTVAAVGKIEDIFAGCGITDSTHTKNNLDGICVTLDYMDKVERGLIYTNLVEFDMLWGHRNDVEGYASGLREFDGALLRIMRKLRPDDMLVITADHGCDPTTASTDHSREYVPALIYGQNIKHGVDLRTRDTFSDLGQTVAEYLGVTGVKDGRSFLPDII